MAKTMSIIRYKYKADRDFESVQFEGMSCSLGELKRLIVEKSIRSGTHHSRDDYDLIISNATTFEEYRDNSDLIPRNTSVVVARRIRGTFESLTPATNQKTVVSSDDIVNEYLRPAILQPTGFTNSAGTNPGSSSAIETKPIPLEMLTQPTNTAPTDELTEDELIKQVVKTSQPRYLSSQRPNTSYTCHHCKQPGHLRNQCPVLLQSSSTTNPTGNSNGPSSTTPHSSHIITNQAPYRMPHYPNSHNRPQHRPSGYTHHRPMVKKPTGIPRADLIQVPQHIAGAYTGPTGMTFIPRPMAQLIVETSEKKADTLAQRNRQFQDKGVLPPAPSSSMLPTKSADEEQPPDDLLCPLCKRVYTDAVITPCCHNSFCDACIRTALVESEEHECPYCHRQQVAIDHINPNLFLRKYVNRWYEERQQKSSYLHTSLPQDSLLNSEQDSNITSAKTSTFGDIENLDNIDEYDVAILPTSSLPVKTAPIVIRMQPTGLNSSPPQSTILTKPADITFEDGKVTESDSTSSSQKDVNSELSATTSDNDQKMINQSSDTNDSQIEKSDRQTPPSQVAPLSTILSSPQTTATTTTTPTMMNETTSVVPHYYPPPPHILPHQQQHHLRPGMMYPQQIPPTDFYPMQPNFYSPVAHVPYPGVHQPVGPLMHHYPVHPLYPPGPHHRMGLPHVQSNQMNGYHMGQFEAGNVSSLHPPINTSTITPQHLQTGAQTIPTPTLSKEEFYKKQRHLQQRDRSTSHRRSRSPSSSSHTSSDSRSSSFSRRNNRRQRSPHSRSRQQTSVHRREDNRRRSPYRRPTRRSSRSTSKQRRSNSRYRSPTHRDRARVPSTKDERSSSHRRSPPRSHRSTRDQERRRSPRPPPTIQQSTQRTIIYKDRSSSSKQHSSRDHHESERSLKHRSPKKEDRMASSPKTDDRLQPELRLSSSPMPLVSDQKPTTPTLSSAITTVPPSNNLQTNERNVKNSPKHTDNDDNSNNEKKRKKHHHHTQKKHRRHRSNSSNSKNEKRHRSKDYDDKSSIGEERTIRSVAIVQT